jgi:hypothetical protein
MKSGLIRGVTSLEQGETIQLYFIIPVNNFSKFYDTVLSLL